MAIFQTGAVTSVPNLLDIIAAFAVANGWTENYNALVGSNRRVHLQLDSDVFINLFAAINQDLFSSNDYQLAGGVNGLLINGSTGYNIANGWQFQPGSAKRTELPYGDIPMIAGMVGITGAMPAYYLFARGDMIYCFLEYATNQYQWLMFGRITKISTWTGGMFFAAANSGYANTINNYAGIANYTSGNADNCGYNPNAYMYGASIDGHTGWMPSFNITLNPAMPKFFDNIALMGAGTGNLSNTFNQQPVLLPIDIAITRDGTVNRNESTNFSIEGVLPDIYFCNLRNLIPAQQLDDGSGDTFRVFPFRAKATYGVGGTGWWGVAIKED